jgi:23S rRNA pseudouridine2605 synthase
MALERLQKIIARAGVGSRRAAEEIIAAGRVRVNGRLVEEMGAKADARRDRIEVDGRMLVGEDSVYLLLHKPRACVATLHDPEGRATVAELVKKLGTRVFPVGRLDYHTSGVLLMTNDGELTQTLLHPKSKVPKVYVAKLDRQINDAQIERWQSGVELDDGRTQPAEVRLLRHERGKAWIEVTLHQGKNRQIHRMAEAMGMVVMRLARVAFAGLSAEGLRPGQWRPLTVDELRALKKQYGVPRRLRSQATPASKAAKNSKARRPPRKKVTAARSDRSGTKPRAAGRRASRARGRDPGGSY